MTPQRLIDFVPLAIQSLTQPRATLRQILAIPANRNEIVLAGWFVIVLNLMFSLLAGLLIYPEAVAQAESLPLGSSVVMLALTLFGGAFLMYRVGRAFGGTGDFDSSLKTVIWLNFILFLVQIPVPFATLHSAETSGLVMLLVLVVAMIQITAQVMELHGFTKVMPVLLGIIGVQLALGFVMLVVFSIMGATLPMQTVK